jgi:hypothetical protein
VATTALVGRWTRRSSLDSENAISIIFRMPWSFPFMAARHTRSPSGRTSNMSNRALTTSCFINHPVFESVQNCTVQEFAFSSSCLDSTACAADGGDIATTELAWRDFGRFGTTVSAKFFITFGEVIRFHFSERFANRRTARLKLPITIRASETLEGRVLNPDQVAWHSRSINRRGA